MTAAGYFAGAVQADTPGFVRFDAPGDKKGKGNGFYKLRMGRWPIGWFGDWKDGSQIEWSWFEHQGVELNDVDKAAMRRERAKMKAEAAQAREAKHAEVKEDASAIWKKAGSDVSGHPYLEAKGIVDARSLKLHTAADGTRLLLVPMQAFGMDGKGELTNLQYISPDGQKRFKTAGRVDGCFFNIGGDPELTVICEGVATAFTIWQTTGLTTVAAFNSGNLVNVVNEFRKNRPQATLMIAGDDDVYPSMRWIEQQDRLEAEGHSRKEWVNIGRKKAAEAAQKHSCRYIMPVFSAGPDRARTDFNDLFLLEGKQAVAGQILGALRSVDPEECAPGEQTAKVDQLQDESWRSQIPTTSSGAYDGNNIEGAAVMIANHRLLRDRLRFNVWTKEMELDGNTLEGHHVGGFRRIMHFDRLKTRKSDVQDEMEAEARRHSYDPLTEYLTGLKWDGRKRIDTWLTEYLGVEDNPAYSRPVGRKFLIGAVARALRPGCKNDTMLVLEGPQGIGKSTAIRYLFGDRFFTDNLPDFHSKDSFQQLQGAWCIEVAELSALSKAEVKDVKQFLSRLVDKFRAPYERAPLSIPRRTVFVGSVNPEDGGYLRDPTGNRRFWPAECADCDLAALLADRDQLWAEAVVAFHGGESWHLVDDEVDVAREEQDKRREVHPWESVLAWYAKREARHEMTAAEALTDALKISPDKQTPQLARQAGAAFRALGWTTKAKRLEQGAKPVKVFIRPASAGAQTDTVEAFQQRIWGDDDAD